MRNLGLMKFVLPKLIRKKCVYLLVTEELVMGEEERSDDSKNPQHFKLTNA